MGKHEKQCRGGDDCRDEKHLCKIVKKNGAEQIRSLVRNSRFFCRKCGRSAHDEKNLCNPLDI